MRPSVTDTMLRARALTASIVTFGARRPHWREVVEGVVGNGGLKKIVGTVWSCKVYVSKPESSLSFRSP